MKKCLIIFVFLYFMLFGEIDRSIRNLGCRDFELDPKTLDWVYPSPAPTFYFGKASVDHSAYMPPVGNQGAQGSCVAWATAYYYKSYMLRRKHGPAWDLTQTQFQMSPSFVYNLINGGVDNGAFNADGFKCLADIGCAPLLDKPYNQSDSTSWGSDVAFGKATVYKGDTTYIINISTDAGINQLKNVLSQGFSAVISIRVWTPFWYGNFGSDGVYDTGDKTGVDEGGHAVCVVGFDDNKVTNDGAGAIKCINSWGTSWGPLGGYFWLTYQAMKDPQITGPNAFYQVEKRDFGNISKSSRYERYYNGQLRVRWKITHQRRERINIRIRFPRTGYYKDYFNWSMTPSAFWPYPNYYISLDVTDLLKEIEPYNFDDTIMIIVRDVTSDGITGTLDAAFVENINWGTYSPAYDLPKSIPDANRCTTRIVIERDRTHWPAFHGMLSNEGYTNLSTTRRQFILSQTANLGSKGYTPVLADINKDGNIDIIVTTYNGYVRAYTGLNLTPLWTSGPFPTNIRSNAIIGDIEPNDTLDIIFNAGDTTYVLKGTNGSVVRKLRPQLVNYTSPLVTNLDGDINFEIITAGESKSIRVYTGSTGISKWYFPTSGVYPVRTNPAIGDVDCNGIPDVVVTSVNGTCYVARRNANGSTGTLVWSYATGDSIYSSPVIANIDSTGGNGRYEVIFGSDDGYLYVINYDGTLKWRYNIGSKIRSTPAVCDVDGNMYKEIIVGADDGYIYFFDFQGNLLRSYNCGGMIRSSPVLVDIDGDNVKDIIVPSTNNNLYAIKFSDASLLWVFTADDAITTPALGDIDNDKHVDIVFSTENGTLYLLTANLTGIEEDNIKLTIKNNIMKNKVSFSYIISNMGKTEIKIMDISGRVIDTYSGFDFEGLNEREFEIDKNGIYFVVLKNNDKVVKEKFLFVK